MTAGMSEYRRGLWMATGAFVIWGLMPLFAGVFAMLRGRHPTR